MSDALKLAGAMYRTFLETATNLDEYGWSDLASREDVPMPDADTRAQVLAILKGKTPGGAE